MEENKFQIGDWVKDIQNGALYKIKEIKEFPKEPTYKRFNFFNTKETWIDIFNDEVDSDEWELWKPTKDKWCWFFNNKTDIPTLAKLIEITTLFDRDKTYIVKTPSCISETSYNYSRTMNFKYCEPFIGELPSFIKE